MFEIIGYEFFDSCDDEIFNFVLYVFKIVEIVDWSNFVVVIVGCNFEGFFKWYFNSMSFLVDWVELIFG